MRNKIHRITAGPFQENGYIIHSDDSLECFIVDPGDSADKYINYIENNDLKPLAIVNTHGHVDHVSAVQPIKKHFSIPFYLHQNDKMLLGEHYKSVCLMYGINPANEPIVDHWINDETELKIGKYVIKIINTPGHTPGGVCFLINGDIFTGDTLFSGSIGRTDLPGGDYETLMNSLQILVDEVSSETVVHSGHGPDTTIGDESRTNPFLQNLTK